MRKKEGFMAMKIRKKLLLCLWIVCACLSLHADDADAAVKKLEEYGRYSQASTILKNKLNGTYDIEHFQALFNFNERLIAILKSKHTRNEVTPFVPPDKEGFFERNKNRPWYEHVFSRIIGAADDFGIYQIGEQIWLNKKATDKQCDALRSINNPLISADEAIFVLGAYDTAGDNIQYMKSLLNQEMARDFGNIDKLNNLFNSVEKQEKQLSEDRMAYLSFSVISPYLWEACRQIFLADSDYLALEVRDKEILDKAVIFLAKSCHNEWINEADIIVRRQFVDTQRALKEVASKTEIEDYKVVTSLEDCLDPSKPRGADLWLSKIKKRNRER